MQDQAVPLLVSSLLINLLAYAVRKFVHPCTILAKQQSFIYTVKSHFIVARLNGELRQKKLILATFIVQTHHTVQSLCLKSEAQFLVPFPSKKEMIVNIQPVTKFTLFQLHSPFSQATIDCDFMVYIYIYIYIYMYANNFISLFLFDTFLQTPCMMWRYEWQ